MKPNWSLEPIRLFESYQQRDELFESYIRNKSGQGSLSILEAGCGRRWTLDLSGIEYTLTGVDLDKDALKYRMNTIQDLDQGIEGDLRYVSLKNQYDVIFNAYVLEHIEDAELVLKNFLKWLKPGGLLILLIPDRNSVYGFVTRISPHWLHILYVRHLSRWKFKKAGKSGYGPYRTVHEPIVSRQGINTFCRENNLVIREEYSSNLYLEGKGMTAAFVRVMVGIIYILSLGTLERRYNNLAYVIEKPKL